MHYHSSQLENKLFERHKVMITHTGSVASYTVTVHCHHTQSPHAHIQGGAHNTTHVQGDATRHNTAHIHTCRAV